MDTYITNSYLTGSLEELVKPGTIITIGVSSCSMFPAFVSRLPLSLPANEQPSMNSPPLTSTKKQAGTLVKIPTLYSSQGQTKDLETVRTERLLDPVQGNRSFIRGYEQLPVNSKTTDEAQKDRKDDQLNTVNRMLFSKLTPNNEFFHN